MIKVQNNRRNGKRYEGELVKILREMGLFARLGRSNEEGDVILPDHNIIIEAKSTIQKDRYYIKKSPDQFERLKKLSQTVFYAVRYNGDGISGWTFYPLPEKPITLFRKEGLTLNEFMLNLEGKK